MVYRNTKQKSIILSIIEEKGHMTINDLIDYIKSHNIPISTSTIYRNLSILSLENKIRKIQSNDKIFYETLKHSHYHFECNNCHKVIDLDSSLINIKLDKSLTYVTEKVLFLYGLCDDCRLKH